jgi:hypothetical protein
MKKKVVQQGIHIVTAKLRASISTETRHDRHVGGYNQDLIAI